jgi:hypothetical protein
MKIHRFRARLRDLPLAILALVLAGTATGAVEVDPAFNFPVADPDLGFVYWCHLLPGGKLLAGGNHAFRLNPDGSRDAAFTLVPAPYGYRKPVLEPGGGFTTFGTWYDPSAMGVMPYGKRFDANGMPDPSFQHPFTGYVEIRAVARDAGGGYLIAGRGLLAAVPLETYLLIRLLPDGAVDPAFVPLTDFAVSALDLQANGDVLVAGTDLIPAGDEDAAGLVRIAANGTVISNHALSTGAPSGLPPSSLGALDNGNLLVGGESLLLAEVQATGTLVPDFKTIWGEGPDDPATSAIARLADGRTLVACRATSGYLAHTREWPLPDDAASWPHHGLFRAMPDGMIDLSFDFSVAAPTPYARVTDLALQSDGKMITADGTMLRRYREAASPAVFAFGEKTVTVSEESGQASLTLYRTGGAGTRGHVTVATVGAGSTASAGQDYSMLRQRVTFEPGVWKRVVSVALRDDAVADGEKSVVVRLLRPDSGSTVHFVDSAQITILDGEGY